ncbi:MAG: response regulator [Leptospiraceae bacterium]|nr:response regulator [Leptospiraceae bacterium]
MNGYDQDFVNCLEEGIVVVDRKHIILALNTSFINLLKALEITDVSQGKKFPADFSMVSVDEIDRAFKGNKTVSLREVFFNNRKQIFEISIKKIAIDEDRVILIFKDISLQVRAQGTLIESYTRLRAVLDSSFQNYFLLDKNGKIILFNQKSVKTFNELNLGLFSTGTRFADLLPVNLQSKFAIAHGKALEGENINSFISHEFDNRVYHFDVSMSPVLDGEGDIFGVSFSAHDISERIEAQLKITNSEENLKSILENTSAMIWSLDTNYCLQNFNNHFKKFVSSLGIATVQSGNKILHSLPNDAARFFLNLSELGFQGFAGRGEWNLETKEMSSINFEVRYAPIGEYPNISGISFIMLDVSDRKRHEEKLSEALNLAEEAAKEKAKFVSVMSHEIRTPLNSIIGNSYLLQEDLLSDEQKESVKLLRYSSEHLLSLVNDVLDFSKIEAGKLELEHRSFSLVEMIQRVAGSFRLQAQKKNIEIQFNTNESENCQLFGDEVRTRQIVSNLLSNAVKFTIEGEILISLKYHETAEKDMVLVTISVSDTGIGIPAEKLESIFESFKQGGSETNRQFGGTGLGLAISRKLADLMNGSLTVKSVEGEGSQFTVELPLKKSDEQAERKIDLWDIPAQARGLTFLLAEDNEDNIVLARRFLLKHKINLDIAKNGIEAVKMASEKEYPLILMDIQMPEMDGIEASKRIRHFNADVPILAMTATAFQEIREEAFAAGINGFIPKPFHPKSFYDTIARNLRLNLNKN